MAVEPGFHAMVTIDLSPLEIFALSSDEELLMPWMAFWTASPSAVARPFPCLEPRNDSSTFRQNTRFSSEYSIFARILHFRENTRFSSKYSLS